MVFSWQVKKNKNTSNTAFSNHLYHLYTFIFLIFIGKNETSTQGQHNLWRRLCTAPRQCNQGSDLVSREHRLHRVQLPLLYTAPQHPPPACLAPWNPAVCQQRQPQAPKGRAAFQGAATQPSQTLCAGKGNTAMSKYHTNTVWDFKVMQEHRLFRWRWTRLASFRA